MVSSSQTVTSSERPHPFITTPIHTMINKEITDLFVLRFEFTSFTTVQRKPEIVFSNNFVSSSVSQYLLLLLGDEKYEDSWTLA
jgi:hypothetical protein